MGIFDSIKNAFSKTPPGAGSTAAPTPQTAPGTDPRPGPQPAARQATQGSSSGAGAAAASTGGTRTCTVVSGDTLWRIAERMYGDGSHYMKIFEANTALLKDPDQIFPGQELVIPEL
jgi:nucleoid-associated protein YgaU